ncbi:hypothetical protein [Lentzea jiangxiensis]|uniref:Uncharacterized protein n=1 Tax=Lentzea jiangxiensis TaxID=641025 RepID=A0A1H0WB71_9PSEU|nr:hypothetical protein [Lentzea jiangxiensis]SDP87781.1 hypothetical protein SAMN05421507_11843 [Lentzea jiangxiensis]
MRDPEHVDPEQVLADQAVIDLPGRREYMKALLWDYRTNPTQYPSRPGGAPPDCPR